MYLFRCPSHPGLDYYGVLKLVVSLIILDLFEYGRSVVRPSSSETARRRRGVDASFVVVAMLALSLPLSFSLFDAYPL